MQSQTPRVSYQLRLRSTLVANSASENNCCPDLPRFDEALSGIIHQYAIEYSYRKNELLDHVLQFPDNTVHDPVKIQTRECQQEGQQELRDVILLSLSALKIS